MDPGSVVDRVVEVHPLGAPLQSPLATGGAEAGGADRVELGGDLVELLSHRHQASTGCHHPVEAGSPSGLPGRGPGVAARAHAAPVQAVLNVQDGGVLKDKVLLQPAVKAQFARLGADVLPGITHWNHPGFFAYFPSNTDLSSVLADLLSSGLGVQGKVFQVHV